MEAQNNDTRNNDERITHTDVDTILNAQEHALQNRTKI